jgi:ADP-ribose pyrophosphatase YjhB (NUDIX family)
VTRARLTCPDSSFIAYENPKGVEGSVAGHHGRVLLCRRAINPRAGFWTLPAGFLDMGETAEQGALREAIEEARATPVLGGILGVSSIPRIGQV